MFKANLLKANQLVQLMHAGYLIYTKCIPARSESCYNLKEWIKEMKNQNIDEGDEFISGYEIQLLSKAEIANPLLYLGNILTLNRISEIRYGLQEWIYCSLNGNSSIATMESKYVIGLFEDLGKLLELLFVLITSEDRK